MTIKRVNKTYILILFFFSLITNSVMAQEKTNGFWNNIRYGGGIGLDFGDGFFSATIAPSAIYEFDNTFALGIGFNATFNNQKNVYKSTILGGSLIGLYNVIPEIQLSAEFEQLNVDRNYNVNLNIEDDNYRIPAFFIGAGFRNGNITLGIRYDLLYDEERSIYIDPWMPFVRFYF